MVPIIHKIIITTIFLLFGYILNAQSFKYIFDSSKQILNEDTILVETKVHVSDKKIFLFKNNKLIINIDANLVKIGDKYLDITSEEYRIGFDPINKLLFIQNKNLNWKIIGKQ